MLINDIGNTSSKNLIWLVVTNPILATNLSFVNKNIDNNNFYQCNSTMVLYGFEISITPIDTYPEIVYNHNSVLKQCYKLIERK